MILLYLGPPDPPSNVVITNRGTTSISLSWGIGFSGDSPLVSVSISYESSDYHSDGTQYIVLPVVYSAVLSGLHPNANYTIHVALVNAAGFTSSFTTVQTSTLPLGMLHFNDVVHPITFILHFKIFSMLHKSMGICWMYCITSFTEPHCNKDRLT